MSSNNVKYDRVLGIDLGNGLVKVRSVDKRGKEYSFTQPSAFTYLKNVGESINDHSMDLDVYTIDDVQYVWGNDITKVMDIKQTHGHENRYRTEAYKIMSKIILAKMVVDLEIEPTEKILIVTGVPSIETGTATETEIANVFLGDNKGIHEVGINDDLRIFKVAHVEVMPQALSTVIGRYLDEEGGVENEDYESMKVAVIDIGGGTIDLDIVHALRRQKGFHSVAKGFRDVYDNMRSVITKKYPSHPVNDYELLDVIEATLKNKSLHKGAAKYEYKPSKLRDAVDLTTALHEGVGELALETQQAIMSKWKNQTDLDEILLVGGSAELFIDYIDKIAEGVTIPPNNGNSNVEGYYRYGVYLLESDE